MVFAGIDWADDHHDVVVLGHDAQLVGQIRVDHSAAGLGHLVRWLKQIAEPSSIACIIETRHGILVNTLLEAGFAVYPVNPKTVDRHRQASRAKTDAIDAMILARHGLHEIDRLRRLEPDNPIVQELKLLTRDQSTLIHQQTRLLNQLTACLKEYYPLALHLFTKLNQPVTLTFLQAYPTMEHLLAADPEHMATLFKRCRHPRPNQTVQKILSLAQQPQLQTNPVITRAKTRLMLAIVAQLTPLVDAIRAYDQEMERLFSAHSDSIIFQSFPGVGERLGPRLLAEWGDDRSRYASSESVAALAGSSPVPFQSGRFKRARKRFACVKSFRDALYRMAWLSTRYEPWAYEYYKRKRAQGKSHSVAVRALSNIWVRIMFRAWMNREPYSRAKFLAAQATHARAA
ncbi:MAG: IS110 family transposase [Ignavibacteriales bacterium]